MNWAESLGLEKVGKKVREREAFLVVLPASERERWRELVRDGVVVSYTDAGFAAEELEIVVFDTIAELLDRIKNDPWQFQDN